MCNPLLIEDSHLCAEIRKNVLKDVAHLSVVNTVRELVITDYERELNEKMKAMNVPVKVRDTHLDMLLSLYKKVQRLIIAPCLTYIICRW